MNEKRTNSTKKTGQNALAKSISKNIAFHKYLNICKNIYMYYLCAIVKK